MFDKRNRVMLLGSGFLILLAFSYIANVVFFEVLNVLFQNQPLVFLMIFIHNVIVVSLVFLGMSFYVNLVVLGYFKREKYAYVVLDHPQIFSILFTFIILFLSILRGANLFLGGVVVDALPMIFLVSTPIGIIEGYGLYLTIRKTLSRTMTIRGLVSIYGIFILAAIIEVGFINALAGI